MYSYFLFPQTYNIDNYFKAYFPAKPIQISSQLIKGIKQISYSYTDEDNVISYKGAYSILKTKIKATDNELYLNIFLEGQANPANGKIMKKQFVKHNDNDAVIYFIKYELEGETINKYGITVIKNNLLYNWAVQEILNYSKLNAENIFNNNLKYFKILK